MASFGSTALFHIVGITPEDYPGGPLAGIDFQRRWEERAFELGGGAYDAPGQLMGDFVAGRPSTEFGAVIPSYKPGVKLGDLHPALPEYAITALRTEGCRTADGSDGGPGASVELDLAGPDGPSVACLRQGRLAEL